MTEPKTHKIQPGCPLCDILVNPPPNDATLPLHVSGFTLALIAVQEFTLPVLLATLCPTHADFYKRARASVSEKP